MPDHVPHPQPGGIFAHADQASHAAATLALSLNPAFLDAWRCGVVAGDDLAEAVADMLAELAARAAYAHRWLQDAHDPGLAGVPVDFLAEGREEAARAAALQVLQVLQAGPGPAAWLKPPR